MHQKLKLGFEIFTERGSQVASQFGLTFSLPEDLKGVYHKFGLDLARFNSDNSWTLPMPARFIIDQQSVIRLVAVDPDYTVRPEPEDTVKSLLKPASAVQAV